MNRTTLHPLARPVIALSLLLLSSGLVYGQQYATTVVSSSGLGTNPLYDDPNALLGQPSTLVDGALDDPPETYHASMVYAPYNTDPNGNDLIVSLGATGSVTVGFSTPIVHSAQHWYGDDLIVFGNTYFPATSGVTPTSNMADVDLGTGGGIYQNGTPTVSVSADGVHFFTLPSATWYPTNPYAWSGNFSEYPSGWNDNQLNNFSQPVNPALTLSQFGGQSVANADANLYSGSAGGAAFSLSGLVDQNGDPLNSISYVRFTGGGGSGTYDIDAVSAVGFMTTPAPDSFMVFTAGMCALCFRRRQRGKQ